MEEMKPVRRNAIEEAIETFKRHTNIYSARKLTKDDAEAELGYSWSNICDIKPVGGSSLRSIERAIEDLRDAGYIVGIKLDGGRIVVGVSISYDVHDRLWEDD